MVIATSLDYRQYHLEDEQEGNGYIPAPRGKQHDSRLSILHLDLVLDLYLFLPTLLFLNLRLPSFLPLKGLHQAIDLQVVSNFSRLVHAGRIVS